MSDAPPPQNDREASQQLRTMYSTAMTVVNSTSFLHHALQPAVRSFNKSSQNDVNSHSRSREAGKT